MLEVLTMRFPLLLVKLTILATKEGFLTRQN